MHKTVMWAFILLMSMSGAVSGLETSNANYTMQVAFADGDTVSNSNYTMFVIIGQALTGTTNGSTYGAELGFLHYGIYEEAAAEVAAGGGDGYVEDVEEEAEEEVPEPEPTLWEQMVSFLSVPIYEDADVCREWDYTDGERTCIKSLMVPLACPVIIFMLIILLYIAKSLFLIVQTHLDENRYRTRKDDLDDAMDDLDDF